VAQRETEDLARRAKNWFGRPWIDVYKSVASNKEALEYG
jgi:hypothetical protein